ncbi:MAG: hypothetical protein AB7F67_16580 [Rhodospirillaceae bacterium]
MSAVARRAAMLTAAAIAAAGVAACGSKTPQRPCPPVLVPRDAGTMIKFRPGPGRDPTDVLYEVRIADFVGTCSFARSGAATVDIKVTLDVRRGPAETTGRADFAYFAAIPRFFPSPNGKQTFPVSASFGGTPGRLVAQEEIRLVLPLRPDERTDEYEIFLALQLTPEEIEYNKAHRQ